MNPDLIDWFADCGQGWLRPTPLLKLSVTYTIAITRCCESHWKNSKRQIKVKGTGWISEATHQSLGLNFICWGLSALYCHLQRVGK